MRGSCRSLPPALLLTVAALIALLAFSVSFAQEEPGGAVARSVPSYEVGRKLVTEEPHKPKESEFASDSVFVSTTAQVDDKIDPSVSTAPDRVSDLKQDLPRVKKAFKRVMHDPAVEREKYELNRPPYFSGRNSIPLRDVEQISKDTPNLWETKESPRLKMVCRTVSRGAINTFCGLLEIPYRVRKHVKAADDPVTGIVMGGVEGFAFGVARTGVGAFELCRGGCDLALFPFKTAETLDHQVMIYPESIVSVTWGEPIPVIADRHNNWKAPLNWPDSLE